MNHDRIGESAAALRDSYVTNAEPVRIVTLDEFVAVEEPGAVAILGDSNGALIPEGGDAMVYGDGGVGKTTLSIDLAFHLAAGDDWLGITVARPVRVLIVENEGPRPLFRKKLARKRDGWGGSVLGDRLHVFENPWGGFSFARLEWRQLLADQIRAQEIDMAIVGPVTSAGMDVAGTINEAREFIGWVDELRNLSGRPIAILLVHHENKGGKVSGAWEGVGDTLLHVQQQGHGKLRLFIQKARWASQQHATALQLVWAAVDGFELADAEPARPERVWEDIEQYVLAHGGCNWNELASAVSGQREYLTRRRDQMLSDGLIVNAGSRGSFKLWHRDDPARATLDASGSEAGTGREPVDSDTGGGDGTRSGSPVPLRSREPGGEPLRSAPPDDLERDDKAEESAALTAEPEEQTGHIWPPREEWAITHRTPYSDLLEDVRVSDQVADYATADEVATAIEQLRTRWKELGQQLRALGPEKHSNAELQAICIRDGDLPPESQERQHVKHCRRQINAVIKSLEEGKVPGGDEPEVAEIAGRRKDAFDAAWERAAERIRARPVDDDAWQEELERRASIDAYFAAGPFEGVKHLR